MRSLYLLNDLLDKMNKKVLNTALLIFVLVIFLLSSVHVQERKMMEKKSNFVNGKFRNTDPDFKQRGFFHFFKWVIIDRIGGKIPDKPDHYNFDIIENDGSFLRNNRTQFTVTWIGHSTLLIQIGGFNILTDPIWSERASPVSFIGPKRHVKPGIKFEDLPDIDFVIISHDHYDHLDRKTIEKLGNSTYYLVPLGVGGFLKKLRIDRYSELDWNEKIKINGVDFICTPAQHFSGRGLSDRNESLWCSWIVKIGENSFFFAGDSGYFSGFREIGDNHGPFDVVAVPIGSYEPRWFMGPVHMSPAEAVQAYLDLKGSKFVPVHWGTFELSDEPIDEPPRILMDEIKKRSLSEENFWILKHGETRNLPLKEK